MIETQFVAIDAEGLDTWATNAVLVVHTVSIVDGLVILPEIADKESRETGKVWLDGAAVAPNNSSAPISSGSS